MNSVANCPDPEQFGSLLEGKLPQQMRRQLVDHLQGCETCRQTLEGLVSSDDAGVDESANLARSAGWASLKVEIQARRPADDTNHAVPDTRRNLPAAGAGPSPNEAATGSPPRFDYLQPSDESNTLGRLDHFEILRVIGIGGMGTVFEGFDTHLRRRVAVKVLNPGMQENAVARERFCREARAAAAISHEHVVAMHHVSQGHDDGLAYLVMQLIDGETLEQRLRSGRPLSVAEVAVYSMQIAAGLSAAHSKQLAHRDIKPANILIDEATNRVKLTDFGLVRAADDVKLTQTGMVTGTPLYMSPEQAMGEHSDERSDLFSLGAVMYEMAVGFSPFRAGTAIGVMKRIMDEQPRPPIEFNPELPQGLSDLIMKLINKQPQDRPDSAAEVAGELAEIVAQFGPISPLDVSAYSAKEPAAISTAEPSTDRRPMILATVGVLAVVALAVAGILNLFKAAPDVDVSGRLKTDVNPIDPAVILPSDPGTVWSVAYDPSSPRLAAALEDGYVRIWNLETETVSNSFRAHRGIVRRVLFHPQLPLLASCGGDGMLAVWDSNSFSRIRDWDLGNAARSIAFAPDHPWIAAGDRDGDIEVLEIESGDSQARLHQSGVINALAYAPDGSRIAAGGSDSVVKVWDADLQTLRHELPRRGEGGHQGPIYDLAFSSDGRVLASVGWNDSIRVWNVASGDLEHSLQAHHGDVFCALFLSGSRYLVTGSLDGWAHIWDLRTSQIRVTLRGHTSAVHCIAYDRVAHQLATGGRDGTVRLWNLQGVLDPSESP